MDLIIRKKKGITSLEMVEQINIFRKEEGSKTNLRHDTMLSIIRDEFEEEIGVQKILETQYTHPQNGQMYPMFELTTQQAKQILMRESKFVRRAMVAYIEKLENKTEEDMLFELFPTAPETMVALTAHNIREVKKLTAEVMHKEDVIIGLVDNIDLATKRQRISQVVRHNAGGKFQDRWNLLYKEFELKYHMDLKRRLDSDSVKSLKPKVDTKMKLIEHLNMIPQLYEIACVIFETDMQEIIKRFE